MPPDPTSERYQYVKMDLKLARWEMSEAVLSAPNQGQIDARNDSVLEMENAIQGLLYGNEDWDNFFWTDVSTAGLGNANVIINRRSAEDGPNPIGFGLDETPGSAITDLGLGDAGDIRTP